MKLFPTREIPAPSSPPTWLSVVGRIIPRDRCPLETRGELRNISFTKIFRYVLLFSFFDEIIKIDFILIFWSEFFLFFLVELELQLHWVQFVYSGLKKRSKCKLSYNWSWYFKFSLKISYQCEENRLKESFLIEKEEKNWEGRKIVERIRPFIGGAKCDYKNSFATRAVICLAYGSPLFTCTSISLPISLPLILVL